MSSWTKRLAVDIRPLRTSRDFRLLWSGYAISFLGSQLSYVAVPYQVFRLTHSSLKVGLIGLSILVPLLITSAIRGYADFWPKPMLRLTAASRWLSEDHGLTRGRSR